MIYIVLWNLQLVLFLISPLIKGLKKVFMSCFTMCHIIVYRPSVVSNAFDKMCHTMEFWIIESWLEYFYVKWTMILKCNLCLVKSI